MGEKKFYNTPLIKWQEPYKEILLTSDVFGWDKDETGNDFIDWNGGNQ